MARIDLEEFRKEEEARNKNYVWKKNLFIGGKRYVDERRCNIERREFMYNIYIPERRINIDDRRKDILN